MALPNLVPVPDAATAAELEFGRGNEPFHAPLHRVRAANCKRALIIVLRMSFMRAPVPVKDIETNSDSE